MPKSTRRMGMTLSCWEDPRYLNVVRAYYDKVWKEVVTKSESESDCKVAV